MNVSRCLRMLAAVSLFFTDCHGREAVVIPDGEYRDPDGMITITVQGKNAVVEARWPDRPGKGSGEIVVLDTGDFYIKPLASTQYDRIFGRREWTWEKDHFVVKEIRAPNRTFVLNRR